jgi:hypothetical protein
MAKKATRGLRRTTSSRIPIATVRDLMRLPQPTPETDEQRSERLRRLLSPHGHDPRNMFHALACEACHRAMMDAVEDADLHDEVRRELRREEIRREVSGSGASRPRRRGPLSAAALAEHMARHATAKRNPDGSRFTDNQRVAALKREQGITVSRTTLVRHLGPFRRPPAPAS